MKRIKYIDGLRGWAIAGVVFIHSGVHGSLDFLPPLIIKLIYSGQFGVQLFFIVSAFTLFYSFNKRSAFEKQKFLSFLIRRFFRIFPMYYAGIIYYSFDRYIGFRFFVDGTIRSPIDPEALLSNIFFVHGFDSFWINGIVPGGWSIAVEMWFYLIIALLFTRIKNLYNALSFLLISLFIWAIAYSMFKLKGSVDHEYFYMSLPNQLPIFAIGIVCYFVVVEKKITLHQNYCLLLFAVTLIVGFITTIFLIYGLAFLFLILALTQYDSPFFINRITILLGKISYSMYVLHFAVIFWFDKLHIMNMFEVTNIFTGIINMFTRFALVIVITGIISKITYTLIELPFQKLGEKLIRKREEKSSLVMIKP